MKYTSNVLASSIMALFHYTKSFFDRNSVHVLLHSKSTSHDFMHHELTVISVFHKLIHENYVLY